MTVREAHPGDEGDVAFIKDMASLFTNDDSDHGAIVDWPRADDVGVIDETDGECRCAAWYRRQRQPSAFFGGGVAGRYEIFVGVRKACRCQGISSALLDDLLQRAEQDQHVNRLIACLKAGVPAHIVERLNFARGDDGIWRRDLKSPPASVARMRDAMKPDDGLVSS